MKDVCFIDTERYIAFVCLITMYIGLIIFVSIGVTLCISECSAVIL